MLCCVFVLVSAVQTIDKTVDVMVALLVVEVSDDSEVDVIETGSTVDGDVVSDDPNQLFV